MWILCVDVSGSMGAPFDAERGSLHATSRLDVALRAAWNEITALDPQPLWIVAFDGGVRDAFFGLTSDREQIQRFFAGLTPAGSTRLSPALELVARRLAERAAPEPITLLIVTDGELSLLGHEEGILAEIGRRCSVHILLIARRSEEAPDAPRPPGVEQVRAVDSAERMESELGSIARSRQPASPSVSQARPRSHASAFSGADDRDPPADEARNVVRFTAAYPPALRASVWYTMLVFIHEHARESDVAERIAQAAARVGLTEPVRSTAQTHARFARGTSFTLVPRAAGIRFNPSRIEIDWTEDIQEITLRLLAESPAQERRVDGSIEVLVSGLPVAQVPMSLWIGVADAPSPAPPLSQTTARVFSDVFASHAREDRSVVQAVAAAYRALGIRLLVDDEQVRAGARWWSELCGLIRSADLFQLFWSRNSCGSVWVEKEWRYALTLLGDKGYTFIRPTYWETDWPHPPRELEHLQFTRLDTRAMAGGTSSSAASAADPKDSVEPPAPAAQPVGREPAAVEAAAARPAATVLGLAPAVTEECVERWRGDAAVVHEFLVKATGLERLLHPLVLVDDALIDALAPAGVDVPEEESGASQRIDALIDLLHAMALEIARGESVHAIAERSVLPDTEAAALRSLCELSVALLGLCVTRGALLEPSRERRILSLLDAVAPGHLGRLDPVFLLEGFVDIIDRTFAYHLERADDGSRWMRHGLPRDAWMLCRAELSEAPCLAGVSEAERAAGAIALGGSLECMQELFRAAAFRLVSLGCMRRRRTDPEQARFADEAYRRSSRVSPREHQRVALVEAWASGHGIASWVLLGREPRVFVTASAAEDGTDRGRGKRQILLVREYFLSGLGAGQDPSASGIADELAEQVAAWMQSQFAEESGQDWLRRLVRVHARGAMGARGRSGILRRIDRLHRARGWPGVYALVAGLQQEPDRALRLLDGA